MNNLGIDDDYMVFYIKNEGTLLADEYVNLKLFLQEYKNHYAKQNGVSNKAVNIRFINWGMEAQFFVLSCKKELLTLLVGQPRIKFGTIKHQAKLLSHFNKIDSLVVAPVEYFASNSNVYKKELMVTPYVYQARCISTVDQNLGVYVPEPKYHFSTFSTQAQSVVKSCMIAKLISCYDVKNNVGLGDVQVFSGDFILDKSYKQTNNYTQTLNKLSLIACRKTVKCRLEEYINLIKSEFVVNSRQGTSLLGNKKFKINTNLDSPLSLAEVEKGIKLGLAIRKEREENNTLTKSYT